MPSIATNSVRTVYPTASGWTLSGWDTMKASGYANNLLGGSAGAQARQTSGGGAAAGQAGQVSGASASGTPQGNAPAAGNVLGGSAVVAVITLLVITGVIWWLAHKTGKESEFANVRASAFNILLITLVAILGILILKVVTSHVNVPGLSQVLANV